MKEKLSTIHFLDDKSTIQVAACGRVKVIIIDPFPSLKRKSIGFGIKNPVIARNLANAFTAMAQALEKKG